MVLKRGSNIKEARSTNIKKTSLGERNLQPMLSQPVPQSNREPLEVAEKETENVNEKESV